MPCLPENSSTLLFGATSDTICHASQVLLGLSKEALSLSQKTKMTDLPTESKNGAQEKLDAAIKEHAAAQEVGTHMCCLS